MRRGGTSHTARGDPPATRRRLRVFAFDPSLAATLDLVGLNIATVSIPFEVDANGQSMLRPGPVGEYIEVVDVDPASDRLYHPVDLDKPSLLASDGLDPSGAIRVSISRWSTRLR